jgi:hypothetical protein
MLFAVLSVCSEEELADEDKTGVEMPIPTPEEIQQIKNKILVAGKMHKVFQILRLVVILPNCL